MKVPAGFRVGAATHTGLVRGGNEDDYVVVAPPERQPVTMVAAIADGMGGVAGGAEASRTGLRGFCAGLLAAAPAEGLEAAVGGAFRTAWERVREQARLVPALRDMGTTMTVLAFADDTVVLGHLGDTRAYRLRGNELSQLTRDHVASEGSNRLLRCIGGGLDEIPPDLTTLPVAPGDRFLLCSDGVWGTVERTRIQEAMRLPAAAAAERLIAQALDAGGPDNCTAVVVHCGATADQAEAIETPLPLEEQTRSTELARSSRLGAPRWPWPLLVLALALLTAVALQWTTGFDVFVWLRSLH